MSCNSLMQRAPESGYDSGSRSADQRSHSSGFYKTSSQEVDSRDTYPDAAIDIKIRLKQLENQLSSNRDLDQYSKALPWFHSDAEKVEFLNSGGFSERQNWLQSHNFGGRQARVMSDLQEVVHNQDIVIGMPDALVKKSWGDPQSIEISGRPAFRNERWKYTKNISTSDGFKAEQKFVYFEGGKVVGWEVE